VRSFNDRGQFVALARVNDEIAPGVVMSPMGAWAKNAKDQSTVNAVNPFVFADLGNAPTSSDPGRGRKHLTAAEFVATGDSGRAIP